MTLREHVMAFHRRFGQPIGEVPRVPGDERILLRIRLIGEEFCELLEALGVNFVDVKQIRETLEDVVLTRNADLVAVADALADLDYVVEGTRLEFGIDGWPIAELVHRSNMAKEPGNLRADGKILKPPSWVAPDIAGELRRQGWSQ